MTKKEKAEPPSSRSLLAWLRQKIIHLLDIKIEDLDTLKTHLQESQELGVIGSETLTMLESVLAIDDLRVRNIMIPLPSMQTIELSANALEVQQHISNSLHSRYPVVDDSGVPQGLLYVKDLVQFLLKRQNNFLQNTLEGIDPWADFNLIELTRQYETVPESTRLSVLLNQFRNGKNHLALVVDEHQQLTGLITIEDVLEQIVGEIRDEYDDDEIMWILDHEHQSTVKGLTPLEKFNEHFNCSFSPSQGETVAGLILSHYERVPNQGEKIPIEHMMFKILKADSRRIYLVSVKKRNKGFEQENENE
jgi:magnesium and cobalt transporter